jgi:ketosteroid isomerase-like protein
MSVRHLLLAALAVLSAWACTPRRFPGTEIADNADTRAVAAAIEAYRAALEKRDAAGVLALATADYFDNGGTPEPADDLDRAGLEARLPKDLSAIEGVKLDFTLRRIEVDGDAAVAEVFFEHYYRVTTPAGAVPRRDSDVHRFRLRRLGGKWLFAAGL